MVRFRPCPKFKFKELSAANYLDVSRNDPYFGGPALLDGLVCKSIIK